MTPCVERLDPKSTGDVVSVLNVGFVGTDEYARTIAKKGDSRDVDSYAHKETIEGESRVLSILRPLKHPDSIRPLLSVLNVSRVGLIEVTKIDAALGECLVAFGCAGIERGIALINPEEGGWVDPEQVRMLLPQAGLDWEILEDLPEPHEIREALFGMSEAESADRPLVVPLDQHFNVQGIGTVGIGYVQSGTIKKHDEVEELPGGNPATVRSLQVMDDDVEQANSGDRVGIAFRGMKEGALAKGSLIVHKGSDSVTAHTTSRGSLSKAPFQKRDLSVGDVVHASVDMQFRVGRIEEIAGEIIRINWDSPLLVRGDGESRVILVQLDALPMRIIGSLSNPSPA